MKSCKNCLHKHEKQLCHCNNRDKWEWDGEPSVCDGCANFGIYQINKGLCHHCLDGDKYLSPEKAEKLQENWN